MTLRHLLTGAAALLLAGIAFAGPGHDHGDAPAASSSTASPRFEAVSDLFEVVGILQANELSVFVDRFADNAPVLKAKVELESGSLKAIGQFHSDHGDYSFANQAFQKPGTYPIMLTITAGDDVDILAGNLVVPDPHAGHVHSTISLPRILLSLAAAAIAIAAVWLLLRRRARRPHHG
jgi:hypothetical protein